MVLAAARAVHQRCEAWLRNWAGWLRHCRVESGILHLGQVLQRALAHLFPTLLRVFPRCTAYQQRRLSLSSAAARVPPFAPCVNSVAYPFPPLQRVFTHFGGYLEMPAVNEGVLGRRHRYVYAYRSEFDDPQIGLAKVSRRAWASGRDWCVAVCTLPAHATKTYTPPASPW